MKEDGIDAKEMTLGQKKKERNRDKRGEGNEKLHKR